MTLAYDHASEKEGTMSRFQTRRYQVIITAVAALVLAGTVSKVRAQGELGRAESGVREHVVVPIEGTRPLAKVADEVQRKYGVPVSYEDAEWVNRDDMMRAGDSLNPRNRNVKNLDMLVPASATLQLQMDVDSKSRRPFAPIADTLTEMVGQHKGRRNPGEFKFVPVGNSDSYSIVPDRAKDVLGAMAAAKTPFDARISFPEKERNGQETLAVILEAITKTTGAKFIVFETPDLAGTTRLGAQNEVARDVLAKALRETYVWKAYWRLFYGPEEKAWGLTISSVYKEIMTPQGLRQEPVLWPR
jgi:hypothetical protein